MKMAIDSIAIASNEIKITSTFLNAVGDLVSTVCKILALIKCKLAVRYRLF
jgi:hypothetical protein